MKVKYPQGDEKQLLKALLNREIPSGKLPLDVGAVIANIGSCVAVYEAVAQKPLYERVVTVTGECIANPKNILARWGPRSVTFSPSAAASPLSLRNWSAAVR